MTALSENTNIPRPRPAKWKLNASRETVAPLTLIGNNMNIVVQRPTFFLSSTSFWKFYELRAFYLRDIHAFSWGIRHAGGWWCLGWYLRHIISPLKLGETYLVIVHEMSVRGKGIGTAIGVFPLHFVNLRDLSTRHLTLVIISINTSLFCPDELRLSLIRNQARLLPRRSPRDPNTSASLLRYSLRIPTHSVACSSQSPAFTPSYLQLDCIILSWSYLADSRWLTVHLLLQVWVFVEVEQTFVLFLGSSDQVSTFIRLLLDANEQSASRVASHWDGSTSISIQPWVTQTRVPEISPIGHLAGSSFLHSF